MASTPPPAELDVSHFLSVLWRRKWIVVAAVLVVGGSAAAYSLSQPERYRSSAEAFVQTSAPVAALGAIGVEATERTLLSELRLAESREVTSRVSQEVGSEPSLEVEADTEADVLVFTASSTDPQLVTEAANVHVTAFVQQRRENLIDDYEASAALIAERMNDLDSRLEELEAERAADHAAVPQDALDRPAQIEAIDVEYDTEVDGIEAQRQRYSELFDNLVFSAEVAQGAGTPDVQMAEPARSPYEPATSRNVLVGILAGLVIGGGVASMREHLDTALRTSEDLADATGVPTLSVVPHLRDWKDSGETHLVSIEEPHSPSAEAYRQLRTSVQFLGVERQMRAIQVTSPKPGDGKSTTAANLAVAIARAGQRVVLVDCDLRKPRVHEYFGLDASLGLTSVLVGEAALEQAVQPVADESSLLVLGSGPIPPDPSELLSGERARSLLSGLSERVDVLVMDSPPVLAVSDPIVLSRLAHGVILVASAGSTDRGEAARAIEHLNQVDAPVIGTVLNQYSERKMSSYGYTYMDYSQNSSNGKAPSPNAGKASPGSWSAAVGFDCEEFR